ncbi:NACHT domain protein [Cladorrhinum sp. PSN259]|nr:NACHT domain protein [Cladorrhinum sp. PSN259]
MALVVTPSSVGPSAGPRKSLEDAVADFQSILTDDQRRKLHDIGNIRDAETVMIFTAQLDCDNQLKKGRGIANRLYSVLQSVQTFSTVVDTFVSSHPEIAAMVWGSIKLTMLIAVNYTSYFEALSGLFMAFSNNVRALPSTKPSTQPPPDSRRLFAISMAPSSAAASMFWKLLKGPVRHTVPIPSKSNRLLTAGQKQLLNALYQDFDQEFKPDLDDIQKLGMEVKDEIALAKAHADRQDQELQEKERVAQSRQRSRVKRFIPKVEKELETIKELQLRQSTRQLREERQRLLEFLSPHDHTTPFNLACAKRQNGTAEWIRTAPEFTRWYQGIGSSLLWCSGKIGSGKTILCASVINHVFANKSKDDRVVFFFLQYDNANSLRAETITRSIIRQSIDTILPEDVVPRLRELEQKLFVALGDWVRLLQQRIQLSGIFYVFIDGLDECDATERRALLDALSSLAATASSLRIFIASRESVYMDLRGRFSHIEHISMASDGVTSDIHLYVEAAVQERIQNEDLVVQDDRLRDDIKATLTRHADGMFVWVTFLINDICTASCDDDIRQSLRSLPKDLEETFTRALSRIVSRQKKADLAQKVFRWVVAAKRPLTLDEIREAVSIGIGQHYSRPERLVRDMRPIVLWCENLLQINEEPQSVQFAHSTIYEFITTASLPPQLTGFHVNIEEADHFAGEICVSYLHFNDFKSTVARRVQQLPPINPMAIAGTTLSPGSKKAELATRFTNLISGNQKAKANPDYIRVLATYGRADASGNLDKLQQTHPFLKYVAMHWIFHTAKFRQTRSMTWDLWHQIITRGHDLAQTPWRESESESRQQTMLLWSHQTRHYTLLRYSNSLGLTQSQSDTLMIASASKGDIEAIDIFLEARGYSMYGINSSLKAASKEGHVQVVKQLLSVRADVDASNDIERGRTTLPAAKGYSIDAINDALEEASRYGHLQVVNQLLSDKGDANNAIAFYQRQIALQAASERGQLQVVNQLLSAGADVNAAAAIDGGRTALQAASDGGHLQVVNQLLSAGAKVNAAAARYKGRTPLEAASAGGHFQVVSQLLSAGANVNAAAAEFTGRTALQAASIGGHLQVVSQLLNAGADVNARGSRGWTALHAASEEGYFQVVSQLLSAGADVNAGGSGGWTALHAASEEGYPQVVSQLLSAGARKV